MRAGVSQVESRAVAGRRPKRRRYAKKGRTATRIVHRSKKTSQVRQKTQTCDAILGHLRRSNRHQTPGPSTDGYSRRAKMSQSARAQYRWVLTAGIIGPKRPGPVPAGTHGGQNRPQMPGPSTHPSGNQGTGAPCWQEGAPGQRPWSGCSSLSG